MGISYTIIYIYTYYVIQPGGIHLTLTLGIYHLIDEGSSNTVRGIDS